MKTTRIILMLLLAVLAATARSQSPDPLTFSVAPGQVTEAAVVLTANGPRLQVYLTPDKRVEFSDFTQRNLDKKVKIIVADKLVDEPIIRSHLTGVSVELIVASPEEGLAVAKALMAK